MKAKVKDNNFSPIVLPFRMEGNSLVVTIHLDNGSSSGNADLMVDTGAPTFISKKLADSLKFNLKAVKGAMFSTPGGDSSDIKTRYYFADHVQMKFATTTLKKAHLLVRTLTSDFHHCSGIDGLLGSDVLSQFNVFVNFEKKEITLYPKAQTPAEVSNYPIAIPFKPRLLGHNPIVRLGVLDTVYTFVWDMGYSGNMYIQYSQEDSQAFNHFITKHPKHIDVETYGAIADVNGRVKSKNERYYIAFDTVKADGKSIPVSHDLAACTYNEKLDEIRANIGIRFMQDYNMFISWKDKKIYLQRDTLWHQAIKPLITGAYYDYKLSQAFVVASNKDSKYYRAGLRAGMQLLDIDGQSVAEVYRSVNNDICNIDAHFSEALLHAKTVTVSYEGQKKQISFQE